MTVTTKKHKHRWTTPHWMSTVGYVKACRAKGCPTPMKAVPPEKLRLSKTAGGA